jgi:hypothetical protein
MLLFPSEELSTFQRQVHAHQTKYATVMLGYVDEFSICDVLGFLSGIGHDS